MVSFACTATKENTLRPAEGREESGHFNSSSNLRQSLMLAAFQSKKIAWRISADGCLSFFEADLGPSRPTGHLVCSQQGLRGSRLLHNRGRSYSLVETIARNTFFLSCILRRQDMAASQGWGDGALPFLAVGRVRDGATLAFSIGTDIKEQQEQTQDVFRKLLKVSASKLSPGQRTRLQWNDGSVCCLMDQQGSLLYCVVTATLNYPERLAYQLLYEFEKKVKTIEGIDEASEHSLNTKLEDDMRKLVTQYEDPKSPAFSSAVTSADTGRGNSSARPYYEDHEAEADYSRKVKMAIMVSAVVLIIVLLFSGGSSSDATAGVDPGFF